MILVTQVCLAVSQSAMQVMQVPRAPLSLSLSVNRGSFHGHRTRGLTLRAQVDVSAVVPPQSSGIQGFFLALQFDSSLLTYIGNTVGGWLGG